MYKSKIFYGFDADSLFNQWIEDHPNIPIMSFRFISDGPRHFAICILYTEENQNAMRRNSWRS